MLIKENKKLRIYNFDEITSTNDFFLEREFNLNTELCISKKQTRGRGQYGRTWLNQDNNALFSLKVSLNKQDLSGFSLVVALSIVQVLSKNYNIAGLSIKWPNDIYLADKKLSGILIENRVMNNKMNVIIGIGINISGSENFANIEKDINVKQLIIRIVDNILINTEDFLQNKLINFINLWQKYDYLMQNNKIAEYYNDVYQIVGINQSGNLLIEKDNQITTINSSKEINFL